MPDARGAIDVGGQAFVLFALTGLSDLTDGAGVHVMTFMTEHEPYVWLNDVIAVGEGSIDQAAGALAMRYSCHVEHRPGRIAGQSGPRGTHTWVDARRQAQRTHLPRRAIRIAAECGRRATG